MSDETHRSAPGNPPGQRRDPTTPAWWGALDRGDLPAGRDGGLGTIRDGADPRLDGLPRRGAPSRLRTVLVSIVAVLAAVAVAWLGLGAGSPRNLVVATLVFGVPATLAAMTATVVVRRGR